MRRIANFTSATAAENPDLTIANTTLEELNNRAQEILRREITNLMVESTGKKLSPTSSAALVAYIRLLQDLKKKEDEDLRNMGDEFLKKIVKND